jgi:hypothetical protein
MIGLILAMSVWLSMLLVMGMVIFFAGSAYGQSRLIDKQNQAVLDKLHAEIAAYNTTSEGQDNAHD